MRGLEMQNSLGEKNKIFDRHEHFFVYLKSPEYETSEQTKAYIYIYMIVSVSHHGCCSCCSSITSHVRPSSTNLTLVYSALFMAI